MVTFTSSIPKVSMPRSIEGSGESRCGELDWPFGERGELPWLEVGVKAHDVLLLSLRARPFLAEIEILLVCCRCEAYVLSATGLGSLDLAVTLPFHRLFDLGSEMRFTKMMESGMQEKDRNECRENIHQALSVP